MKMAPHTSERSAAVKIQKAWRCYCTRRDAKSFQKRALLMQEIANLERTYVSNIAYICVLYEQPMREKAKITGPITDNLLDSIFLNLPEIVKCHTIFSSLLQKRDREWMDDSTVGDCFVDFSKRFQPIYTKYILGFPAAMEKLEESMQNNSTLRAMVQLQYDADPNMKTLTLEDMLMMPVQRMPRYELLLASMLKSTPRQHKDYLLLTQAQQIIQGLCTSFNANKSEAERRYREARLLTELGSYDIPRDPRRYMVLEGDVVELCRTSKSGTNTRKLRRLFLFSDIVVCAKPIRNSKNAEMLGDYIYKPKWMVTLPMTRAEAKDAFDSDIIARAVMALSSIGSATSSTNVDSTTPLRGHVRSRSEGVTVTSQYPDQNGLATDSATSLTDVSLSSSAVPNIKVQIPSNESVAPPRPTSRPTTPGTPRTPTALHGSDQANGKRRKSSAFDFDSMLKSLSLRRNATKSNLQDVAEPPLSPAPSSGNAHRGDDILLLISGSMCIDRDRASVLCQELLDRGILEHAAPQPEGEFRASSTHMYKYIEKDGNAIAEPAARIQMEIEALSKDIQWERTQLAALCRVDSSRITKGMKGGMKKRKDALAKSLEDKQKALAALKERQELHRYKAPFELLSCFDGFHMFSHTLYTNDYPARDQWVGEINTRCDIALEATGSEGHLPEGLFRFKQKGSKRYVRCVSNVKPKNTNAMSASTEMLYNTSLASLHSVSSRGSVSDPAQKSASQDERGPRPLPAIFS